MGILFTLLVLVAIGISLRCGSSDGLKMSAAIFICSAATMIVFIIIGRDWQHFNSAILAIDIALLAMFAFIAFNAPQRWPLIVCAMQFVVAMSHVAGMVGETPASRVLGVAQGLWAYIQCFAIIFGVTYNRVRSTSGPSLTEKS